MQGMQRTIRGDEVPHSRPSCLPGSRGWLLGLFACLGMVPVERITDMKKILALAATLFISASVFAGEFPDISVKEVKSLVASKKAVFIDVNGSESYAKAHVPGALDFDAIEKNFAKSLPADKSSLIVAYCGGPRCKAYKAAAEAAEKLGYKNVKHMSAGISGWTAAGEKTETAKH